MRSLLIIVFSFTAIYTYGQIDESVFVGATTEGIKLYTNSDKIKVENEYLNQYKVWLSGTINENELQTTQAKIFANFKIDKLKKTYSTKMLYYVDCKKEKLDICRAIFYDKNGDVLLDAKPCENDIQYDDVIPDTLGESIFEYVCKSAANKRKE